MAELTTPGSARSRAVDFLKWPVEVIVLCNQSVAIASVLVGISALSLRLLLTPLLPLPQPGMHDEFSYLLAADTFAHGRLTNPTHPMWRHFETFHELSHPTYASKYPPGQGLVLALGQIFHAPWAAVWVSMAVLCGLVTWALWVWLEPPWAIVAGLLTALQLTGSYWTETYWGGTVAAIGGTLVIGALARLNQRPAPGPAAVFGLGLAVLANTRPYEGLVLGGSCAGLLFWHWAWLVRRGCCNFADLVRSAGVPMILVLLPILIWMGYYNYRVTGSVLQMPYLVYDRQYALASQFLWSTHSRPAPQYNLRIFSDFWVGIDAAGKQFQRQHFFQTHLDNLKDFAEFFLDWPLAGCVVIALWRMVRNRDLRVALLLLLIFYLGLAVELNFFMHYAAPATVLLFLIAAAAVREVSTWIPSGRIRTAAVSALFACIVLFDVSRVWAIHFTGRRETITEGKPAQGLQLPFITVTRRPVRPIVVEDFVAKRQKWLTFLSKQPGQHLVLVRYGPYHVIHREWVFNDADIDGSRIVWARSLPRGQDRELLQYYPNRQVWTLDEDD